MPISPWYARWRLYRSLSAAVVASTATLVAHAQAPGSVRLDPTPTLQASQAGTPVPAAAYRSVFADLPRGVETTAQDWKAANAAVGQFKRGHADLLKWELEQARTSRPPTQGAAP